MRTFYAIQTAYDDVHISKIVAENEDEAYDMVDYNNLGGCVILRAEEATKVMNALKNLKKKRVKNG